MSELGTLLELLHGAFDRFETCRATMTEWRDHQLSEEAMRRWTSRQGSGASATYVASSKRTASVPDAPSEQVSRWWIKKPSRLRHESTLGGGHRGNVLMIREGGLWWRMSDLDKRVITNQGSNQVGSGQNLRNRLPVYLDPARIIPTLSFEVLDRRSQAGRPALRARATPRDVEGPPAFGFADEYDLSVDAEKGVVLRSTSRIDGKPYHRHELTEVEFDLEIPDDLFVMTPPPGTRVQNVDTLRLGRFRLWWWRMMASRRQRNRPPSGTRR